MNSDKHSTPPVLDYVTPLRVARKWKPRRQWSDTTQALLIMSPFMLVFLITLLGYLFLPRG
jgi:hypothetical protein